MSEHHVLLADESPTVRGMLAHVFSSAGFSVETAGDGLEALQAAFRRPPDLAIMEARMRRVGGIQVCRVLKAEPATSDVPVILLSGQENGPERIYAVRAGADLCLGKDATPEGIMKAARERLAGKPPRPAAEGGREDAVPGDMEILLRVNQALESGLFAATLFNAVGQIGREVDDFESTLRAVNRLLMEIVPHEAMAAVFSDGISLECVLVYPFPEGEDVRRAVTERLKMLVRERRVPSAPNRTKVSEFFLEGRRSMEAAPADVVRPWLVCPIRAGEVVKGLLVLFAERGKTGVGEERLTEDLLRQGFLAMENAWLYRQISRMSATDGLTGLYNHRHFLECLKTEHTRSMRYKLPFSVLMVDIDHFKKVNDVYGHPVGDTVLREISGIMGNHFRSTDLTARYGGEEFVALLPETGVNDATMVADRLRQTIERTTFASPSPLLHCTVSIGVSSFRHEAPLSDKDVLSRADEALYDAKRQGRNRVCIR